MSQGAERRVLRNERLVAPLLVALFRVVTWPNRQQIGTNRSKNSKYFKFYEEMGNFSMIESKIGGDNISQNTANHIKFIKNISRKVEKAVLKEFHFS